MTVIIVLDLNDIEGSYSEELIEGLINKNVDLMVAINKMDTFPVEASAIKLRESLLRLLKSKSPYFETLVHL